MVTPLTAARLTILLPLRNYHDGFLAKAFDSVFEQTSSAWRLVVLVEEPDRPHFAELLATTVAEARVELIVNEGRGLAGALNTGMRHARTEFVTILLGDDMLSRDAVRVVDDQIARHPQVDFFHSARQAIDENDDSLGSVRPGKPLVRADDFLTAAPVKHLLCWRREMGLTIGGMDESLSLVGADDYDFPWSMAERGAVFRAIPECLYYYRDHRESYRLSTHPLRSEKKREVIRMWRKHGAHGLRGRARALRSSRAYLRQSLYRSRLDRWRKERRGFDPREGWRLPRR